MCPSDHFLSLSSVQELVVGSIGTGEIGVVHAINLIGGKKKRL
jgi:hypothetical protein